MAEPTNIPLVAVVGYEVVDAIDDDTLVLAAGDHRVVLTVVHDAQPPFLLATPATPQEVSQL
jgi:hypothetical protein